MRELKFRAWDKVDRKMEPIADIDFLIGKAFVGFKLGERQYKHFPERIEIMQYTGLKDKNGKEIYEGDIVQFISNDKFLNKTGIVTWDDEGADYNITGKHEGLDTEFECAFGLTDGEYEVIGSIYENSELLNN